MSNEALTFLAASMLRDPDQSPIPIKLLLGHPPPIIAVTYFGQFIDHDLTCDSTPLREAGHCEPRYTINHRTPWLDLDHLYGEGPASNEHGHLYDSDGASFRLGYSAFGGEPFDVPLTSDGRPAIVDERNGENLIIRQIHAMFLKLHNVAVRELSVNLPARERFDRARERVRWQYQWLVRAWYLQKICHRDVYEAVVEHGNPCIDWETAGFSIPVEFAVAGMRFGHSMVRHGYELNALPPEEGGSGVVPLRDLFGGASTGPLHRRLKIDWPLSFDRGAMAIDTSIVKPLFHLPDEQMNLYVRTPSPHLPRSLALRTLSRGAAVRLPTGQQVRDAFGIPGAICETPPEYMGEDPWQHLCKAGLATETPLWYYVLLEAQLDQTGDRLGKVGSRLVVEVIEGSLRMDPQSFLRRNEADWRPGKWHTPGGELIEINTLLDLAMVAGV